MTDAEQPEQPACSPTIAHAITDECARQAWAKHRLLGNRFRLSDQGLKRRERGKAIHNLVLENGDRIVPIDADSYQSNYAKENRDKARRAGQIPVLEDEMTELKHVAAIVADRIAGLGYDLAAGTAEEKIYWHEATSLGDVLCDGVVDWHSPAGRIIDIKSTEGSVHPDQCGVALVNGAGVIQDCAYRCAIISRDPGLVGRTDVLFLFCQSREPYMVTPVWCDGTMQHIGETRWLRALETWARCLAAGTGPEAWPEHTDIPIAVSAPGWVLARERELEDMGL